MKNTIYGITLGVIALLVITITLTVTNRNIRQNEIAHSIEAAIEQSVDTVNGENIQNQQEFLADVTQGILMGIQSNGEVTLCIAKADQNTGILSVKAEEKFYHPNGQQGQVSAAKTVVLEQYAKELKKTFTICYRIGGELYKTYRLQEGSHLLVPTIPTETFHYWMEEDGKPCTNMENQKVTEDRVFYAMMGE
ncbi:MAG: hypothetical protein RSD28_03985 [Lachnospiraceae bacterium]